MEALFQYLATEWQVIKAAPVIFLTGATLIAIAVFIVVNWFYRGRLDTLDSRLKLKDDLLIDYQRKLSGATPDEAKAQLDKLQSQLNALMPRQLTPDQMRGLGDAAGRLKASVYLQYDLSCSDGAHYREQLAEIFDKAGWQVHVGQIGAPPIRAPSGLGLFVNDPVTTEQAAMREVLRDAKIEFDQLVVPHSYRHIVMHINSRFPTSS